MNTHIKFSAMTGLLLTASFLCSGTEFRVNPDDDSFDQAAKNWKKGIPSFWRPEHITLAFSREQKMRRRPAD